MSILKSNSPIGVFDSGIGGLTIAKTLVENLPNESMIYFGDTAHLPYGDKSTRVIQNYTKKIADFLLSKGVKLILVACNSASAAAYEDLQKHVGKDALLVNVIDPVTRFLNENYVGKRVGLIGTKITVQSEVYNKKLSKIDLQSLATPLLVPIIEEGFFEHELIDIALAEYLLDHKLKDIEALILGCTHYPVIKKNIERFYDGNVEVIDSSKIVVDEVKSKLAQQGLLSSAEPEYKFYVSDLNNNFAGRIKLFFNEEAEVDGVNIF